MNDADLSSILQYGEGLHFFPKVSAEARYLATETLAANRQQAYRDAAEEELGEWIRWSDADVAQHRNGLTPGGMEITGLSRWYVSHFYNRKTVMSESFREKSIEQVKERVEHGAGWLVVSSKDASVPALIETGRRVERMWLGVREKGIAMHPMTQMLEEAPWRDTVAARLGIDAVPQFLLRVGYVDAYPEPMSVRMPLRCLWGVLQSRRRLKLIPHASTFQPFAFWSAAENRSEILLLIQPRSAQTPHIR